MGRERAGAAARVLIVIPSLGRRVDYLQQTLQSIADQQVEVDVAAVLPRSAAEARELCTSFGARVLDDPGSMSAAVNIGLMSATQDHVFGNWIGDDDLLLPGSLRTTIDALDRNPGAVLAYGHCEYIDEQGRRLWVSKAGPLAPWLLPWGPDLIPQPGALFRLGDFKAVGGLDESLRFAMDLDLLLRLKSRGQFVDVRRPVSAFRWHATSLTVSDRAASLAESEAVKRRYLPGYLQPLAPMWEAPVRLATRLAARQISRRAMAISEVSAR